MPPIPRVDAASQFRRAAHLKMLLDRLNAIQPEQLSPDERINAAVFRTILENGVEDARFREWEMPFNSDSSFWTYLDERNPFEDAAEYRRYIADNRKLITAAFYVGTRDGRVMEDPNSWLINTYSQMIQEGIDAGDFKKVPVEPSARLLLNVHANAVLGLGIWRPVRDDPQTERDLEDLTRALLLK